MRGALSTGRRCCGELLGHLHSNLRVLHLGIFPCFAWASGARHWSASELQKLKALPSKMMRRIAHQTLQHVGPQWRQSGIPRWDHAVSATW